MRDGHRLGADLWLPRRDFSGPTVLVQTPYNRKIWRPPLEGEYAWVVLDWRGFYGSKSARVEKPDFGCDGYDAVEWIAAQAWSNGQVATWGQSALGRAQFWTAAQRPPHLLGGVPIVASAANFHGQYYSGGILRQEYVDLLDRLGFTLGRAVREHREHDDYWKAAEAPVRIDVPMLLIGGWFDLHPAGVIESHRRLPDSWLVIGPWNHHDFGKAKQGELGFPEAEGVPKREAERFLRFLFGIGDWNPPRVRVYRMGEDRWRTGFDSTGVRRVELGDGAIAHDPARPVPTIGGSNLDPALGPGPRDQSALLARGDVHVWTAVADVALAGAARLRFRADGAADFHARLCEVLPDGRTMLIVDGARRSAGGDVEIEFPPTAMTFRRIRVILGGSNHPRFELAPAPARVRVKDAFLELPVC